MKAPQLKSSQELRWLKFKTDRANKKAKSRQAELEGVLREILGRIPNKMESGYISQQHLLCGLCRGPWARSNEFDHRDDCPIPRAERLLKSK